MSTDFSGREIDTDVCYSEVGLTEFTLTDFAQVNCACDCWNKQDLKVHPFGWICQTWFSIHG